jgi:hypothetical protein
MQKDLWELVVETRSVGHYIASKILAKCQQNDIIIVKRLDFHQRMSYVYISLS